jgi:thioredoxin reductase (NADPH)
MVIFGRTVIEDPTPERVARLLGIGRELVDDEVFDVVIIGVVLPASRRVSMLARRV